MPENLFERFPGDGRFPGESRYILALDEMGSISKQSISLLRLGLLETILGTLKNITYILNTSRRNPLDNNKKVIITISPYSLY